MGSPSSISARARAIHSRRQVVNFLSGEKMYSLMAEMGGLCQDAIGVSVRTLSGDEESARKLEEHVFAVDGEIDEMEREKDNIDYELAARKEKELRHDVMAHIHAYGALCPNAMPIIHLGATSCYVGDNTDIIIMREGLQLIRDKLVRILDKLGRFAAAYKALPTLGYTHYQAAQMVTVGKRATLWMNELLMDLEEVEYRISTLKLLGSKGTTGTQASFLELFEGDHEKVKQL